MPNERNPKLECPRTGGIIVRYLVIRHLDLLIALRLIFV
jgi:hypothetical protein